MNRSRWSIVPVAVLSAGLFAACSSSSTYTSTATTKAAGVTTPAAAATTPAAAATTPAAAATTPAAAATTPAAGATTAAAGAATTAAAAAGGASSLDIKSFAFNPAKLSAKAGTDIAVKNEDSADHTVTSDDGKAFNVPVSAGATATIKGVAAGTYAYHCAIHPSMKGTLTVA